MLASKKITAETQITIQTALGASSKSPLKDSFSTARFLRVSYSSLSTVCSMQLAHIFTIGEEEETAAGMSSPPAPRKTSYKETLQIAKGSKFSN